MERSANAWWCGAVAVDGCWLAGNSIECGSTLVQIDISWEIRTVKLWAVNCARRRRRRARWMMGEAIESLIIWMLLLILLIPKIPNGKTASRQWFTFFMQTQSECGEIDSVIIYAEIDIVRRYIAFIGQPNSNEIRSTIAVRSSMNSSIYAFFNDSFAIQIPSMRWMLNCSCRPRMRPIDFGDATNNVAINIFFDWWNTIALA